MSAQSPATLGILGGMGPAATADFYARVVHADPATTDQEHIPVLVWGDPRIPDRVAAVRGTGPSPAPALAAGLRGLVTAGAQVVVMPCNTAHAFLAEARELAGLGEAIEVVDMIEATAEAVCRSGARRSGLLATAATLEHGMYAAAFAQRGAEVTAPAAAAQARLLELIRLVKTGTSPGDLIGELALVIDDLAGQGADHAVMACTEVSVVAGAALARGTALALPVTDASEVLARAAVSACRG